jgi:pimeloyl-ACP methyl ester carboxylesterase
MPAVNVDGASLDYIEQGNGQPLIFVHGSISDRRSWEQQIGPFAERYRVVAYTRRHHHGSEDAAIRRPLSVTAAADDLLDLIDALGNGRAHIVGSSYGAFASLLAARKRPTAVSSLVLGEPPIGHLLTSDPQTRSIWDEFMTRALVPGHEQVRAGDVEGGLRTFLEGVLDMMPAPGRERAMDNAATMGMEQAPLEPFDVDDAARLTMPVLLVSGERTPGLFDAITSKLRALLPEAEHTTIPAASHGMHGENAAAYNAAVLAFLARHA